mgnify:CR=1 FL=1
MNEDILGSLSNEQYKEIKNQMGLRLKGNESRLEVEKMFLNEVQMSLNSKLANGYTDHPSGEFQT